MNDETVAGLRKSMSPGLFEKYCSKLAAAVSPEKMARPDFEGPGSAEKPQRTTNPLSTAHSSALQREAERPTSNEADQRKTTEKPPETKTNFQTNFQTEDTDNTPKERQLTKITQKLMKENEKLRETQKEMAIKVNELALLVQEQQNATNTAMADWQLMLKAMNNQWEAKMSAIQSKVQTIEEKTSVTVTEQPHTKKTAATWDFAHHQEPLNPLDTLTYAYQLEPDIYTNRKGVHDIPTLASYLCSRIPSIQKIYEDEEDFETKMEKTTAAVLVALPRHERSAHPHSDADCA